MMVSREDGLCRDCHKRQRNQNYASTLKEMNIQCPVCKKLTKRYSAKQPLCPTCFLNASSTKRLREYLASFFTPYRYNQKLFDLLAANISWENIKYESYLRFRELGKFLQQCPLKDPLNWEEIDNLLSALIPRNKKSEKHIREGLVEIGHLLVASGKLESWESYLSRRRVFRAISCAPESLQPNLKRYAGDLMDRKYSLRCVTTFLLNLNRFWGWCQDNSIVSIHSISDSLIHNFLLTLQWKWKCKVCQSLVMFNPQEMQGPGYCHSCGAVRTHVKVKRYSYQTVVCHLTSLRSYFRWARINRLIAADPTRNITMKTGKKIRYYPEEFIKQLCEYLGDSEADPREAFALYLILFHGVSIWELQHAQIPVLTSSTGMVQQQPLKDAYCILIPKKSPSRRKLSRGRPRARVCFPEEAAAWLKPLLDRFDHWREQHVKNEKNKYVFCPLNNRDRHLTPINVTKIHRLISSASLRVLGVEINPKILRQTIAIHYMEQSGPVMLRWMGWSGQTAFDYTWMPRELVQS